jgi:hypothetical protein
LAAAARTLNGAADVTWKVERSDGFSRVTIDEIKDGPSGLSWTFRLVPFNLPPTKGATKETGKNQADIGSELETCVVELLSEPSIATRGATKPPRRLSGVAGGPVQGHQGRHRRGR